MLLWGLLVDSAVGVLPALQDHAESAKYLNDIKQGTTKQNPVGFQNYIPTLEFQFKLLEDACSPFRTFPKPSSLLTLGH